MLPTKAIRLQLGELLVADATTLAPAANANKIVLVTNTFTENESKVIGDFTPATFTGSTPLAGATGAQQAGVDPLTGDQVLTILPPAGGYRWECTAAPATPEEITGYILVDNGSTTLLAMKKLAQSVVITNVGDFVDLGTVTMRMVAGPLS